jgi:hypothetical protein
MAVGRKKRWSMADGRWPEENGLKLEYPIKTNCHE